MKQQKPDFNKIPKIKKVGGKKYYLVASMVTKYREDKSDPVSKLYNAKYYKFDKTRVKGITLVYWADIDKKGQYDKAIESVKYNLAHIETMRQFKLNSDKALIRLK